MIRQKKIDLPEEKTHWRYSSYGNGSIKEPAIIQNMRQFQIANDGIEYYLQISLSTWYVKGPADMPYSEITEKKYFKFNNKTWIIIYSTDNNNKIKNISNWENVIIHH